MSPDALASPVARPDIPAPTAEVDPFAPVGRGGLGLTPPGNGVAAFAVPEATAPAEAPGFVERLGGRIGDNFTQAFSTPLGPGDAYRDFVSPLTTPTGYGAFDAMAQPIYNGALIGVPSLLDAAGRTIGAAYYSLVDGGTEVLTSAGMDRSSAERLGRDLKAMPEAFAGSPSALTGTSRWPTATLQTTREELAGLIGTRARQLELGTDPVRGYIKAEGIAGIRMEQAFGRQITRGTDSAIDFVDRVFGPISLKGPIPVNGDLEGLAAAAIGDAMGGNTATRTVVIDTLGLSNQQFETLRSLVNQGANKTQKRIIFLR